MPFSSILAKGFMDRTSKKALKMVADERDKYKTVYETIESYCRENKLILSNRYILCEKDDDANNIYRKVYKIYTSNPFRHANSLTNKIYQKMIKEHDAKYTRLKTLKEKEEFVIEYDLRQMAMIYKVQKHKQSEPIDIIKPVNIKNLLYMPSEIELIDVYHTLYDPSQYSDWSEAQIYEKLLFKQVEDRKEQGILGAGDCKERKKHMIEALKIDLVTKWLVNKDDTILIGPWAHDWIKFGRKVCVNREKVQIISKTQPEELLHELKKIVMEFSKFEVSMREQELHIPKDFRTNRYTYYIHIQTSHGVTEKPFLDLFNCANFEVVPAIKIDDIHIGTKNVILRFLFIDLWIIRVIKSMGILSSSILQKKIDELWKIITFFRSKYEYPKTKPMFIGLYRSAVADKKMSGLQGKMFFPYYPYVYVKQNNSYRDI